MKRKKPVVQKVLLHFVTQAVSIALLVIARFLYPTQRKTILIQQILLDNYHSFALLRLAVGSSRRFDSVVRRRSISNRPTYVSIR
ncbi:hypothetical protein C450_04593 [Halococcus salifodinae DSM 8989]|uniref:Uncharacterized protein n=1 Tax=Halococcus salifodinae DSM 8989 TaxID=1227456 RepID=M0NA11_9EURY|nr:hypothetical protein C450_04593 [Halococcus salifodinae DSM 8989]